MFPLHQRSVVLPCITKGVPFERLPPTKNALFLHTKRAMLQSNIWMNSLKASTVHGDPSEWGWKKNSFGQFTPFWSNLPAAVTLVQHFVKCFCTKKYS